MGTERAGGAVITRASSAPSTIDRGPAAQAAITLADQLFHQLLTIKQRNGNGSPTTDLPQLAGDPLGMRFVDGDLLGPEVTKTPVEDETGFHRTARYSFAGRDGNVRSVHITKVEPEEVLGVIVDDGKLVIMGGSINNIYDISSSTTVDATRVDLVIGAKINAPGSSLSVSNLMFIAEVSNDAKFSAETATTATLVVGADGQAVTASDVAIVKAHGKEEHPAVVAIGGKVTSKVEQKGHSVVGIAEGRSTTLRTFEGDENEFVTYYPNLDPDVPESTAAGVYRTRDGRLILKREEPEQLEREEVSGEASASAEIPAARRAEEPSSFLIFNRSDVNPYTTSGQTMQYPDGTWGPLLVRESSIPTLFSRPRNS